MCEVTYDIIDWKSCESGSELGSSPRNSYDSNGNDPNIVPKASGGSNSDHIVFPTLFYEDETETSIVTLPDADSECWRSGTHEGVVPDDIEQLSVYQKVANWVSTQKGFFRKDEDLVIEDDDLAVIDPVDLFQSSVLDEYLLIAEDDQERRAILRDLNDVRCDTDSLNSKSLRPTHDDVDRRQKNLSDYHRYDIESVQELMQAHEYKFIREPKGDIELELEQIIEYGNNEMMQKTTKSRFRKKKISTCSAALDAEGVEEKILFLGVPRLLENYVILNREGYVVKPDQIPDLWLSPFQEDLPNSSAEPDEANMSELEFLSSWFSDVIRTDDNTMERRQTTLTDMLEKLTVITVGSDDEVWLDAPEIPHWLDEEQEELELFNQPSRPLYYYRDRIKGCYRIIGVEDETVVLFSGNDDDTIFYTEEDSFNPIMNSSDERDNDSAEVMMTKLMNGGISYDPRPSFVSRYRRIYNRLRYGIKVDDVNDAKNDSGIDEDIDENACDDLQVSSYSLSNREKEGISALTDSPKRPSFAININPKKESFVECLFVVMGAIIVLITLVLYKNDSPTFQLHRSKITEEVFDDLGLLISGIFK